MKKFLPYLRTIAAALVIILGLAFQAEAQSQLVFTVQPGTSAAGSVIAPAITVSAEDATNNIVTGYTGDVTISLINPGSGTLSGTLTVPAVNGVATFSDLAIDKVNSGYMLSATDGTLTSSASSPFDITAGAFSQLVFTAQPSNAISGVAISPSVTVTAEDASGNVVSGYGSDISISIGTNPNSGTLSGAATATAVNGVATFSGLSIDKAGTGYTLSASDGTFSIISGAFNITAGAAANLSANSITTQSGGVGSPVGTPPSVLITDASGNPVPGVTVTFTITGGGGTVAGGPSANVNTGADGIATVSDWTLGASIGTNSLSASGGSLVAVTFNATGTAGAATQLVFSTLPTNTVSGASIAPAFTVTAEDAGGNVVTTYTGSVTLSILTNPNGGTLSGTNPVTAVNGVATFSDISIDKAGTGYVLSASDGSLSANSSAFNITPGAISSVTITSGPIGTQTAGVNFAPVSFLALDANGNPVNGGSLAITTTTTSITPTTVTLDANGTATVSNFVMTAAGMTSIKATSGLVFVTSNTFMVNAGPLAAFVISPISDPQTAGVPFSITSVTAQDAYGNILNTANGNPFTSSVTLVTTAAPTGTVSPTTSASFVDGVLSNQSVTVSQAVSQAIQVTSGAISATSNTFSVNAGGATQLIFNIQPSNAVSGASISPAITVQALDAGGNLVTGYTGNVTISIGTNPAGNGTLSGTLTVAAVGGVATFSNLSIDKVGTGYTLLAGDGTLTSPASATFNITVGAAANIAYNAGNSQAAVAGSAVAIPPSVIVTDANGNPVTGASVTFSVTGGGGSTTPPSGTVITNSSGIASITWTLGAIAGSNTLSATAALAGSPINFNATGTSGGPSTMVVNAGAGQSAIAGTSVATAPSVIVKDVNGNPVSGVTVTFAIGIGSGSVTGATAVTDATGIATVGSWTLGTVAGTNNNTLIASASGVSNITFTASATTGPLAKFVFSTISGTKTAGTAFAVTITAEDANNNTVTTFTGTATLSTNAAFGSVAPITTNAFTAGVLTQNITLTQATTQAVTATSASITGTSANINVNAGTFTKLQILVPGETAAPGSATGKAGTPTTQTAGSAFNVIVNGVDANWNIATVTNDFIRLTSSDGIATLPGSTRLSTTTNSVTLSVTLKTAGSQTVTATDQSNGSRTANTSSPITVNASTASIIAVNTGAGQSAAVNTAVPVAPSVKVTDAFGNPISGVNVTFSVSAGGGSITGTQPVVTNASGIATVASWTLGTAAGTNNNTLRATSTGLTGSPVLINASATAGPATTIAANSVTTQSAIAGTAVAAPPSVIVKDAFGNPVSGVAVVFTITGGGGTTSPASPATLNTNASGIATLTSWTLGGTIGTNTLTATSGTLSGSPVTFTATGTVGALAKFAFVPTIGTQTAGTAFPVTIIAQDANGNTVTTFASTVALTTTAGTITPVTSNAFSGGTLTQNVTVTQAGTGKTITATNGSTGVSNTFTVNAGAAVKLQILLPGETAAPGTASGQTGTPTPVTAGNAVTVTVNAVDANFNVVSSTDNIQITSSDAAATLPANNTLVGGTRTFSVTFKTAGAQTATATDLTNGSITADISSNITVNAALASTITINAGNNQSAAAGTAVATAPSVIVKDAFGNPVSGTSITFSILTGGGSITGGTTTTNASGIATIGSWTLGTAAGTNNNTLKAAIGTTPSVTFTASAVAGPLAKFAFVPTIGTQTAGTPFSITIIAQDAVGNTVTSFTGTVALTTTAGIITPSTSNAFTAGTVTQNVTVTLAGTGKTITATSGGSNGTSNTFTVNAGAATQLLVLLPGETLAPGTATGKTGTPTAITAGGSVTATVDAVDAGFNLVTSNTHTIHITSTDAFAGLPANAALAGGTGTFSVTLNTAGSQTITATDVSAGPLTANISSNITVNPGVATQLQVLLPGETAAPGSPSTVSTIVNYNFNAGNSFGATVSTNASGITSSVTGSNGYDNATGVVSGSNAFTANTTAGNALQTADNTTWTFTLGGASLSSYKSFNLYYQLKGSAAINVSLSYSVNGGGFTSTGVTYTLGGNPTALSGTGTWVQALIDLPAATDNPTSLLLRLNVSSASGFNSVQLDNFEVQAAQPPANGGKTGTPIAQQAGVPFNVIVNAVDANYNVVPNTHSIKLTTTDAAATMPGAAALVNGTQTVSVTLVSVGTWTITGTDQNATPLAANTSSSVTVNPGPASKLVIFTQPTAPATNGGVLATQPVVRVTDQYGNVITGSTAPITAAVGSGAWTIGGTTLVNAASGVATFTNLTAGSTVNVPAATITFSSPGLTSVTSTPAFAIPPPATTYYNVAGADLSALTSWGTNTDGSGANPGSFTFPGQTYNIVNGATATITANTLTIPATSTVNLGNGTNAINFTVPAAKAFTGPINVLAQATLTLLNTTLPTLGTLNVASTVVYGSGTTVVATNYGNLGTTGTGTVTLASTGTIGVVGVFTPTATVSVATGSTVSFVGTNPQTIPAFNYNNLTSTNNALTLASTGTIGIAGTFTPGAGVYTTPGSTVNFNGSGAQTIPAFSFNNLTVTANGTRTVTLVSGGTINIAGTFSPTATNTTYVTTNNTVNFNGTSTQTIPAFSYNNLQGSNNSLTLASTGTINIAGTFTPGAGTYTVTGSTVNFNGASTQTIPAFNYNNLQSSNNNRTLAPAGTIGIAGAFTPGTGTYTVAGSTVNYNGSGGQTIAALASYNNLTVTANGTRTVTLANGSTYTISGIFNPDITTTTYTVTGSTVSFNGGTAQTIPAFTYYTLLLNNIGAGTLGGNATARTLTFGTNGNISLGAFNLTVTNSLTGVTTAKYVKTNGTGQLMQTVGTGSVLFPVGNTDYDPITLDNTGGTSDVYGVSEAEGAIPNAADPSLGVNRTWKISEAVAGGSSLKVVGQFNPGTAGEVGSNFPTGVNPYVGFWNGTSWTVSPATSAGTNPTTFTSTIDFSPTDLTNGTQYFALGKDNVFTQPNVAVIFKVSAPTPTSPNVLTDFSVTVTAYDAAGNVANVVNQTAFSISTNGVAGSIGGVTTGFLAAGTSSVVVSGITLSAQSSLLNNTTTVTATAIPGGDNLSPGVSPGFNVVNVSLASDYFKTVPSTSIGTITNKWTDQIWWTSRDNITYYQSTLIPDSNAKLIIITSTKSNGTFNLNVTTNTFASNIEVRAENPSNTALVLGQGAGGIGTLTCTGNVQIDFADNAGNSNSVLVGASTLNVAGNIDVEGANNTATQFRVGALTLTTGTVNLTGNLVSSGQSYGAQVNLGTSGTFNIAGDWNYPSQIQSGGGATFNSGTGTVNFNGTTVQHIGPFSALQPSVFQGNPTNNKGFYNLVISNTSAPVIMSDTLNAQQNVQVVNSLVVKPGTVLIPEPLVVLNGYNSTPQGTISGIAPTDATPMGIVQVTKVTGSADYVNQYLFTTNTLPNVTVDYSGIGAQTVSNNTFRTILPYGNLILEGGGTKVLFGSIGTTTGTITNGVNGFVKINPGTAVVFNANNSNITLGGDWINNVGASAFVPGSGTVYFNSGLVQNITSTLSTVTSQTFNNVTIGNTGGIGNPAQASSPTTTLNLNGTMTINAGANFTIGTASQINIAGSFFNNSSTAAFNAGAGTVAFNSASAALPQIIGGSAITTFNNLTIQNTAVGTNAGVTLIDATHPNVSKNVNNLLTLTSGLLTTDATDLLILGPSSSTNLGVPDVSTTYYLNGSYVNGPLQKQGTTAFTFPVGKAGIGYAPISIGALIGSGATTQTFTAEYIHTSAYSMGPLGVSTPQLTQVSGCDYWRMDLGSGYPATTNSALPTGVTTNLTMYWSPNNPTNCAAATSTNYVTNLSKLAIGHLSFVTGQSYNGQWYPIGTGAYQTNGSNATGSIYYAGVSTFSPFTLGSTDGPSNPLPIKLEYFTATKANGFNKLTWKAECTSSSAGFEVERSSDGVSFTGIHYVAVDNATDCAVPFAYDDYTSTGTKVYYRIKMIDIDGNVTYSEIKLILNDANTVQIMSMKPNPLQSEGWLDVSASQSNKIELVILTIDGREVVRKTVQLQPGSNTVNMNTASLAKGMYIVRGIFNNGGQTNVVPFIKQ